MKISEFLNEAKIVVPEDIKAKIKEYFDMYNQGRNGVPGFQLKSSKAAGALADLAGNTGLTNDEMEPEFAKLSEKGMGDYRVESAFSEFKRKFYEQNKLNYYKREGESVGITDGQLYNLLAHMAHTNDRKHEGYAVYSSQAGVSRQASEAVKRAFEVFGAGFKVEQLRAAVQKLSPEHLDELMATLRASFDKIAIKRKSEEMEGKAARNEGGLADLLKKFDDILMEMVEHMKARVKERMNSLRDPYKKSKFFEKQDYRLYVANKVLAEVKKYSGVKDEQYISMKKDLEEFEPYSFGRKYRAYDRDYELEFLSRHYTAVHDEKKWKKLIKEVQESTIEWNKRKLREAVLSYTSDMTISDVEKKYVDTGTKGFEGIFELKLADGTSKFMHTRAIEAGGYNIQKFHYRYIINVHDNYKSIKKVGFEDEETVD